MGTVVYTKEIREKMAKSAEKSWKNPEYRKIMVAKQKALGYRTYPS